MNPCTVWRSLFGQLTCALFYWTNKHHIYETPLWSRYEPLYEKNGLCHYANNNGTDQPVHPEIGRKLATELGPIFAHLFQQSIDTGEIPKEWSLANICHLFKKSDRSLACNYRPVSLTCVPCMLLEHIVDWLIDCCFTARQHRNNKLMENESKLSTGNS